MLKIQVLGHGLIPRGMGIAPRKEPFYADLNLIGLILQTPGLSVNYVTSLGTLQPLTTKNLKKVWDASLKNAKKPAAKKVTQTRPAVPAADDKKTENGEKKEEPKPQGGGIKPVHAGDKKNDQKK